MNKIKEILRLFSDEYDYCAGCWELPGEKIADGEVRLSHEHQFSTAQER